MATNPHPEHQSPELWWFVEQLELLEAADTVFAGAWGDFKSGYHCDAWTLWNHKENGVFVWRDDYSIDGVDDQVLGDPNLERLGAAVDWTFLSAQAGNYANIRKYSNRVMAAFKARDPRLKGWREVLCNADDGDTKADGFDFVGWYTRNPDGTHEWHIHFSVLRKFLRNITIFQAMISILKGETLAQWQAGGKDTMAIVFKYDGKYRVSKGDAQFHEIVDAPVGQQSGVMNCLCEVHRIYPDGVAYGNSPKYPSTDLKAAPRSWTDAMVVATFGPLRDPNAPPPSGGGDGTVHKHAIQLQTAVQTLTGQTGPAIPA